MKKILLTAAAVSVLATSSAYAMENSFYIKANAGGYKFNQIKTGDIKKSGINFGSFKLKSNNDVHVGVGAGYHVMDNFRVELMFDHYINPTHKASKKYEVGPLSASLDSKLKTNANTLLLNGFVDVYEIDSVKFFIGAGIGASQLKGKFTTNLKENATNTTLSSTGKIKSEYKFAFAGYAGASYKFTPELTGELSYSYRNLGTLGKDKDFKDSDNPFELRGHHVTAGVRFDI
jgi:opacity protein-like surface antigen